MADATIELNEGQRDAAAALSALLATPDAEMMLLKGYAGTGKTSTLLSILGDRADVLYLAPSNAAMHVIKDALPSGAKVATLQQALGARCSTGRSGQDTFSYSSTALALRKILGSVSIVVLDECSMVGGGLWSLLLEHLGFVDGKGARFAIERSCVVSWGDLDQDEHVSTLLFGHGVDPLDETSPRDIAGRPHVERLAGGDKRYTWWVEGGRKPIKLVVMGDPAQLPPIAARDVPAHDDQWFTDADMSWAVLRGLVTERAEGRRTLRSVVPHLSPSFEDKQYNRVAELTKIMRSADESLALVNLRARTSAMMNRAVTVTHRDTSAAIEHLPNRDVVTRAVAAYRAQEDVVVLCWRNSVKDQIAQSVRRALLGEGADTNVLHAGEPCIFTRPYKTTAGGVDVFFKNGDLVYVRAVREGMTAPADFPTLHTAHVVLTVTRARDGIAGTVRVMPLNKQGAWLREVAAVREGLIAEIEALEAAAKAKPEDAPARTIEIVVLDQRIDRLNELVATFAGLESSYTRTCHKAQGGSWGTVFYLQPDVSACRDPLLRGRLAYVAISRARHKLVVTY